MRHTLVPARRSPSPPPQYDSHGGRVNTREKRYRQKLEMERHRLIEEASRRMRDYIPPADYRKPTRYREKVLFLLPAAFACPSELC